MNSNTRSFSSFVALFLVASCGGGGGGGGDGDTGSNPITVPDVAGTWEITETHTDDCGDGNNQDVWTATITQDGISVTVSYGGVARTGTMNGNVLTWSGSYPEEGGTTTVSSLTITFSGDSASGSATWSWTDGSSACSGTTAISAQRSSTSGTVPGAPTGLNAVATSSGSVDLTWQDNADNEDAYIVERSEVSSTTGFSVVTTLPADSQLFSDTGLAPSTTYYYRVASSNTDGQSGYSNVDSATTDAAPPTPPVAPSNLDGSATSSTSVDLFWTDQSDNESRFDIYQAISPAGSFTLAQSVSANVISASVGGLVPNTTYAFKVVAVNSAGPSLDSNIHEITTPPEPIDIPNPPSALTVGNATHNSLTLNWSDNSDNETGFRIYRATSQNGTYTQIASTSATSYTNTGLSSEATYWYKVSAYNDAGESAQTAPESGTTESAPITLPNAPTGLSVGGATDSSLTLSWTDNSNNETGFRIYRSGSQSGTYTQIATTSATSYTNAGLSSETTYWYKVSAYNDAGESAQTAPASGTTLAPPVVLPNPPSNPVISNVTATSATMSWTDNSNNESGFQVGFCTGLVSEGSNGVMSCLPGFNPGSGFVQIDQVGANVTSYTFTGLSADTQYSRFVRAYNTAGSSDNTGVRFTTAQGQQTVTLQAIASNVVMSNSLDSSWADTAYPGRFPAVGIMWASSLDGFPGSLAHAGLVKFDVSTLQGRTIDAATLNLEVNVTPVGFFPQNFDIGTVATSWNTSTVTWNQMMNFLFYNAGWRTNNPYPTFPGQTYSIDLTGIVQNWANGTFDNNGLGFLSSNYGVFPGNIDSLDAYDFFYPTLTVTYR
jgi:fibronectin type 3 domain-containing protein